METDDVDPANLLGEFTLEDTYDHLKEVLKYRQAELEELINIASNNELQTLSSATAPEIVEKKQCDFLQSLINNCEGLNKDGEPMLNTADHYISTIQELEEAVKKMAEFRIQKEEELQNLKSRISSLKNEETGLVKMKEACVGAIEDVANSTYDAEYATAGRLFSEVKKDLATLVRTTVIDNDEFPDFFADLITAYQKGGDDVYVNVSPEFDDCVRFLVETDVAIYHRNDKNKVRLADLIEKND